MRRIGLLCILCIAGTPAFAAQSEMPVLKFSCNNWTGYWNFEASDTLKTCLNTYYGLPEPGRPAVNNWNVNECIRQEKKPNLDNVDTSVYINACGNNNGGGQLYYALDLGIAALVYYCPCSETNTHQETATAKPDTNTTCTLEYPACGCGICPCLSGTVNSMAWSDINQEEGYQRSEITSCSCDNDTCEAIYTTNYAYRCAAGYYGKAKEKDGNFSGCTQCPEDGITRTRGTTEPSAKGGETKITDCKIMPGTSGTANGFNGKFKFTYTGVCNVKQ